MARPLDAETRPRENRRETDLQAAFGALAMRPLDPKAPSVPTLLEL